ncbi:MAG: hypothetical protein CL955_01400 [Erythrobacteraceae bacterium]|nr:hypothetical protein [Erythrobacteraceae bacterium]
MLTETTRNFFEAEIATFRERGISTALADDWRVASFHQDSCGCVACHGFDLDEKAEGGNGPDLATGNESADTAGGIATTATLTPGSFVIDELETAGDSDWFRITLEAGETYTFTTFLPPGGLPDSILTLRDANGVLITQNDDAIFGDLLYSEITFTATTSGTYYLDVTGFGNAAGQYVLSSSRPVDDAVAGDNGTTASLTLGAEATAGTLDVTGDRDWYAVTLEAGQTYEFITSATGGGNDVDTTLTLRTASGEVLAYNDDSTGTYSRIRFTADTSGTFYLDLGGWADGEQGDYQVTFDVAPPLQELTPTEIAAQLLYGTNGGPADLRRFNVSEGGTLDVNLTTLNADGQFLARAALQLWSDVTGIIFNEVPGTADITFQDTDDGAFASSARSGGFIINATVNVSTQWLVNNGTKLDSYSFQTYLHEIGHALGLRHPGPYNGDGSFDQDAVFLNDSWATTVMSYFSQTENSFFAQQGFSRVFTLTPMIGDLAAIDIAYGYSTTTRTGDTVYGVGNNTGRDVYGVGPEVLNSQGRLLGLVIYDNGGIDTLDYSSFSAAQLINLNSETFSNVGGSTGNLSIAANTVIENAVGGSGNDTLIGNDVVNFLTGRGGNDNIDGGSNVDTAVVSGNLASYTITQTSTGVFRVVGADGTDTLTNIEFLQFDDQTLRLLRGTGVSVNFETADPSVYQSAMNNIRDFDGNALGGNGSWLRIGSADVNGDGDIDQILVNDAIGRFATVGTAPDGLTYFEDYSWAGETRVAGIYIDPLVQSGDVVAGSDNDSQRRFQNDLEIENINRVLGSDDYDGDGVWEVYFALTDGTAYLRALMHEDGNIRYANYQSEQEVIDYLTANGYDESTFGDWFTSNQSASAEAGSETATDDGDKSVVFGDLSPLHDLVLFEDSGMRGGYDYDARAILPIDDIRAEFYG